MEATVKKQDGNDANAVKIGSKRNRDNNTTSPSAKLKFELDKTQLPLVSRKGNYHQAIKTREEWLVHNDWNSVTTDTRKLPANVKYMVVDVETHDWKEDPHPPEGRIVEIAWKLYDEESCIESKQYLIKPHGYNEISQKATSIHGITTERAISQGSHANLVFDEFTATLKTLPRDGFVIAHSMPHDNSILMHNLNQEQGMVWKNAPKCDTHEPALLTHVPHKAGYKYTAHSRPYGMKLAELHSLICTEHKPCMDFAHMAGADVEMTWNIFQFYKRKVKSHEELKWPIIRRGLVTKHKEYSTG